MLLIFLTDRIRILHNPRISFASFTDAIGLYISFAMRVTLSIIYIVLNANANMTAHGYGVDSKMQLAFPHTGN